MMPSTAGFAVHELVSIPRREEQDTNGLPKEPEVLPALIAAHAELIGGGEEPSLLHAWIRDPSHERFRLIVGANPRLPSARPSRRRPGHDALLFPPGSVGRPLPTGTLQQLTDHFPHWVRCTGHPDLLPRAQDQHNSTPKVGGTFSEYAAHLRYPFAWLVIAEPISRVRAQQELQNLATDIPRLRLRTNSEADRIDLERAESRYRELTRGLLNGLWMVHVLVGAGSASHTRSAAALLCAASGNCPTPYILTPDSEVGALAARWRETITHVPATSPFLCGSDLLAALTAPPAHELPGIQLLETSSFDVTADNAVNDGVHLGTVLDRDFEAAGPFTVDVATLNRHAFVSGATGSGKSQTTRWLLEQLATRTRPIPWLVLEPAKAEYARMAGRVAGSAKVIRIRPGDLDVSPASINPLEPASGFPLQSHADLVRALFLASFEADEPFPQILAQALTQTYRAAGWDLVTGEPTLGAMPTHGDGDNPETPQRYPTLDDVQSQARRVVDEIGYSREITANVRGFIDVRIGSLCHGTPGRFFRGGHPLDIERLLESNVVLELEPVTDDQDKAFLMGALIIRIVEHLRVRYGAKGATGLRHVIVVEEAHRLLKKTENGAAAAAVELFASMLAEIRAYGEGLVIVEQIPSKILTDVIKNTALKVMHRLPADDDRRAVGGTINMTDEQSRLVVALPPGTAAAAVDGMDRPVLIQLPDGQDREDAALASDHPPLASRRSQLCGAPCQQAPCTLRQINTGDQLSRQHRMVVWTEAVVVSMLAGFVPPLGRKETLRSLRGEPPRIIDCTLVHAVQTAIGARRSWLLADQAPTDLVQAVHRQLDHQIKHAKVVQDLDYRRRQAGPHRYHDIESFLTDLAADDPIDPELVAHWVGRGLDQHILNDPSCAAIRAELDLKRRHASSAMILGDTNASGLTSAVQGLGATFDQEGLSYAISTSCTEIDAGGLANTMLESLRSSTIG